MHFVAIRLLPLPAARATVASCRHTACAHFRTLTAVPTTSIPTSNLIAKEVERLVTEKSRRCLWLVGTAASRAATKTCLAAVHPARETVFFDFASVQHRNFEIVLETLEHTLGVALQRLFATVTPSVSVEEMILDHCLRRLPRLANDLVVYAEAVVAYTAADVSDDGEACDLQVAAVNGDRRRQQCIADAVVVALANHRLNPNKLWSSLAELAWDTAGGSSTNGATEPAANLVASGTTSRKTRGSADRCQGLLSVLQIALMHAEQKESLPGYVDRPTGKYRVPGLLTALEAVALAANRFAVVAFLHIDVLMNSLFIDGRGEELLGIMLDYLQRPPPHLREGEESHKVTPLRAIFQTSDSPTAFWALSPPTTDKVVVLPMAESGDVAAVGVLTSEEELGVNEEVHSAPAHVCNDLPKDKVQSSGYVDRIFEWQMDQVLAHPAVLNIRSSNSEAPTAFALVLWESIRHICRRSHLSVPARADDLNHPIVQALLHANLLEPRWGPTRLVVAREDTKQRLLRWIDEQHAKLSWSQRAEYNLQLIRARHEITRQLDRLAC